MIRVLAVLLVLLCLAGCDTTGRGTPETLGAYTVWLSHEPDPLKVGYDADFRLLIHNKADAGVEGCKVQLRQYMPDMEMSDDQASLSVQAQDDGVYTAHSREFTMGGKWAIEMTMNCGDGSLSHTYHYTLEWPE